MKSLDPESDEEDQEMDEMIISLKNHLKECQKLGKYVEAQMAQNRIAELKEKKSEKRMNKLQECAEKETKILADRYEKELEEIEKRWEEEIGNFENEWRKEKSSPGKA